MSNVLSDEKGQQVFALGRLGWTLRRIEQASGLRRDSKYALIRQVVIRRGLAKPALNAAGANDVRFSLAP
jgi:hypothetical protein